MDMNMNVSLIQKQTISQNMIQSMNILQMSAVELEEYLENLSLENPVIELQEPEEQGRSQTDLQRKLEWLESTDSQNRVYYQQDQEETFLPDLRGNEERLSDYLLSQIILNGYTRQEYEVIAFIIQSLDERGYFTDELSQAARRFGVSEEFAQEMLLEVQKLDPVGVGARNVGECLLLQLAARKDRCPLAETIVSEYLTEVAKNHLPDIAQKTHTGLKEVTAACEVIRSLNPKPGSAFSDRENLRYISPDVIVIKTGGGLEILVNEYQYPRFTVSEYYTQMLQHTEDQEAKQYLQEKMAQAKWVSDCITHRSATLSNVMKVLVDWQQAFFQKGKGYRRPMKLSDLAEPLEVHESTISRAMKGKYLQCAWGVFPLNYFLSAVAVKQGGTGSPEEGEKTTDHIKQLMRELIAGEDKKKPYSDQAIAEKLKENRIEISRRTVNKYRQEMNIPDKTGRRSWETE